jgi:putative endonuclease
VSDVKKDLGIHGEQSVVDYLQRNGFAILARNYRKQYGEIDIIARKKDLLIFVEVKTRYNPYFDTSDVITPSKQRKIVMVAKEFLATQAAAFAESVMCRFDVALLTTQGDHHSITYIPHAFESAQ